MTDTWLPGTVDLLRLFRRQAGSAPVRAAIRLLEGLEFEDVDPPFVSVAGRRPVLTWANVQGAQVSVRVAGERSSVEFRGPGGLTVTVTPGAARLLDAVRNLLVAHRFARPKTMET